MAYLNAALAMTLRETFRSEPCPKQKAIADANYYKESDDAAGYTPS